MNYFKLLEIKQEYELDPARLTEQYFLQLAKFHPDRAREPKQKLEYQDISINLNKAYSILKDDLKRAMHILNLQGIATDEVSLKNKISKEELAEVWRVYEECDATNTVTELKQLLELKLSEQQALNLQLKKTFKDNNLPGALDIVISFKYLMTLIDNIKSKIKNANN